MLTSHSSSLEFYSSYPMKEDFTVPRLISTDRWGVFRCLWCRIDVWPAAVSPNLDSSQLGPVKSVVEGCFPCQSATGFVSSCVVVRRSRRAGGRLGVPILPTCPFISNTWPRFHMAEICWRGTWIICRWLGSCYYRMKSPMGGSRSCERGGAIGMLLLNILSNTSDIPSNWISIGILIPIRGPWVEAWAPGTKVVKSKTKWNKTAG